MLDSAHILAIDEGTTNAKAILVDASGRVVARGSREVRPTFPQPAWVEQDPMDLWQATRLAIREAFCLTGWRSQTSENRLLYGIGKRVSQSGP